MGFFSACCSSKTNHIEVAIMQFIKLLPIGKNGNRFRKSINPLSGYNDSKVTAKRPTKKKCFWKIGGNYQRSRKCNFFEAITSFGIGLYKLNQEEWINWNSTTVIGSITFSKMKRKVIGWMCHCHKLSTHFMSSINWSATRYSSSAWQHLASKQKKHV